MYTNSNLITFKMVCIWIKLISKQCPQIIPDQLILPLFDTCSLSVIRGT